MSSEKGRMFSHLQWKDRLRIEKMLKEKKSKTEIARTLRLSNVLPLSFSAAFHSHFTQFFKHLAAIACAKCQNFRIARSGSGYPIKRPRVFLCRPDHFLRRHALQFCHCLCHIGQVQ